MPDILPIFYIIKKALKRSHLFKSKNKDSKPQQNVNLNAV